MPPTTSVPVYPHQDLHAVHEPHHPQLWLFARTAPPACGCGRFAGLKKKIIFHCAGCAYSSAFVCSVRLVGSGFEAISPPRSKPKESGRWTWKSCGKPALATLMHQGAPDVEVAIVITDDESLQELNRRFRGIDAPTDVLAFPNENRGPLSAPPVSLATWGTSPSPIPARPSRQTRPAIPSRPNSSCWSSTESFICWDMTTSRSRNEPECGPPRKPSCGPWESPSTFPNDAPPLPPP